MSQKSPSSAKANAFFEEYSDVSIPAQSTNAGHERAFLEAVQRSNAMALHAWETRDRNPVPWIHNSIRWRLLHLTLKDYAEAAGLKGYFTVKTLENPDVPRDLRIHDSAHASYSFFESSDAATSSRVSKILALGRQKFLDALVEPYALSTEKLLLKKRIVTGPAEFDARTDNATPSLRARMIKGRVTPFSELVRIIRALHFSGDESATENNERVWNDPEIQAALDAYTTDQQSHGMPKSVAEIMAAVEFTGHSFTTDELKTLGLSQDSRKKLTNKRMTEVERLLPLRPLLEKNLGVDATDSLFDSWSSESKKVLRKLTFSKQLRGAIENLNLEPGEILPLFGMDPEEHIGHEVMRSALERGPSKRMPLIALTEVLADDEREHDRYEKRSRSELRDRWSANRTKASSTLPAELQYCGVEIDDLGFNEQERLEFAKLQRGDPSALSEREVLKRIYETGVRNHVVPVLERWVASQRPVDVSRLFELISLRSKGELRSLVKAAKTSEFTVGQVRKGEALPLHALMKDYCAAAGVALPAAVEIGTLMRITDAEESASVQPLGRAMNALIFRSHRHAKTFRRDQGIEISDRTFVTYLSSANDVGSTDPRLIAEMTAKSQSDDREALGAYLGFLAESGEEKAALLQWIELMMDSGKAEYIAGLEHLQAILKPDEKASAAPAVQTLDALRDESYRLRRWKYGKKDEATEKPEDLSTEEERLALKTLSMLPGISRQTVLSISMQEVVHAREGHTRRVCELLNASPDNPIVADFVQSLLAGDEFVKSVFYGDQSDPGSGFRVSVLRERNSLGITPLHFPEDRKIRHS